MKIVVWSALLRLEGRQLAWVVEEVRRNRQSIAKESCGKQIMIAWRVINAKTPLQVVGQDTRIATDDVPKLDRWPSRPGVDQLKVRGSSTGTAKSVNQVIDV